MPPITTDGPAREIDLSHRLLTPKDVAGLLCLPVSTVYELARGGRLPSLRIGRAVRFERHDLETYIARNAAPERLLHAPRRAR